jgi:hypothetical protein
MIVTDFANARIFVEMIPAFHRQLTAFLSLTPLFQKQHHALELCQMFKLSALNVFLFKEF